MKKLLSILLSTAMLITAAGCGSSGGGGAAPATDNSQAQGKKAVLQIGMMAAEDSLWIKLCRRWSELAAEQSNGELVLEVYPAGQLGTQSDLFDQMFAGAGVIAIGTAPYFSDLGVPDFGIVQAPFLVENWEQMLKITHSDWWAEQSAKLEEKGIKIISFNVQQGKRHTLTTKPVKSLADLKGLKIRVPTGNIYIKTYEALGAAPTPMNLGEVYTAMQQGTIDGQDNTLMTMYSEKHYEVGKHLLLDGHIFDLQGLVMGAKSFNALSPEHQRILIETCELATDEFNKNIDKENAGFIQSMKEQGVTVVEEINYAEFAAAAEKFYDYPEFSNWTEGLYDTIKAIINE